MAIEDEQSQIEEDPPISYWEDVKQRIVDSLWHDLDKRNTLIFCVIFMWVAFFWGLLFE